MGDNNFIDDQILNFFSEARRPPRYWVNTFLAYYKHLYEKNKKDRKTTGLSTTQWALSVFKKKLQHYGIEKKYIAQLKLPPMLSEKLRKERTKRLMENANNLEEIDVLRLVNTCRTWILDNDNPGKQVIALALITGRRISEILYSIEILAPTQQHDKHEQYWSCLRGFSKSREPQRCRDCPIFMYRDVVKKALVNVRNEYPADSISHVNKRYSTHIARLMKRHLPSIAKIHTLRKLYVSIAFEHFNENNESIASLYSRYLGHRILTGAVLPYMSVNPINVKKIKFPLPK